MSPKPARFPEDIQGKKKVSVRFYSEWDIAVPIRVCVPLESEAGIGFDPSQLTIEPATGSVLPTGGLPAATVGSSGGTAGSIS